MGGSRFPWSFGDDEALLNAYANRSANVEVKQKLPNPLGLYDMHGNLWEWTRDSYNAYQSGVFVDPPVSDSGICKFVNDAICVVRGGSFFDSPEDLRSANRGRRRPETRACAWAFAVSVSPSLESLILLTFWSCRAQRDSFFVNL